MQKKSIKYWRNERGLSQYELAEASGVPRYRIQLYEQGVMSLEPEELRKLCSVLGLEPDGSAFREQSHEC